MLAQTILFSTLVLLPGTLAKGGRGNGGGSRSSGASVSGMSMGTKVLIGVIATLAGVLVLVGMFLCDRKKRRRRKLEQTNEEDGPAPLIQRDNQGVPTSWDRFPSSESIPETKPTVTTTPLHSAPLDKQQQQP